MDVFPKLGELMIHKVEQGVDVTFPVWIWAALGGIRVLDSLYVQEKDDYEGTGYTIDRRVSGRLGFNEFDGLRVRFISRMTSYIILVCTIDGILMRSYKHLIRCLTEMGCADTLPGDAGKALLRQRSAEIKDHRYYRDKVFAHTAFASPRKDSRSLQYSSLAYLTGTIFYMKKDYLALGGGAIIVDSESVEGPPELSIVKRHGALEEHYTHWERMFVDILEGIPRDDLSGKVGALDLLTLL